jgi:tetratricopeptide (TPR) repeat protein
MNKFRPKKDRNGQGPFGGDTTEDAMELNRQGAMALSKGDYRSARQLLERAYALAPENGAIAINLGGAHLLLGKHQQAVPILEKAAELEPANPMVWINLAAAYLGFLEISTSELQTKAIEAYQKALSLDPKAASVHYNLGLIYAQRAEMEKAIEYFRLALQVNPQDHDAAVRLKQLGRGSSTLS